jgi:hypothetical protein
MTGTATVTLALNLAGNSTRQHEVFAIRYCMVSGWRGSRRHCRSGGKDRNGSHGYRRKSSRSRQPPAPDEGLAIPQDIVHSRTCVLEPQARSTRQSGYRVASGGGLDLGWQKGSNQWACGSGSLAALEPASHAVDRRAVLRSTE